MEPISYFKGIKELPIFCAASEDFDASKVHESGNDIAYIIDAKGWKLSKRSGLVAAIVQLDKVDGLETIDESFRLVAGKIPISLIQKVTAFYREVYRRHKSEAAGLLVYRKTDGEWDYVVPRQTANGGSAVYEGAREDLEEWLDHGYELAGTIHSHGSMSAFHSGTDSKDEAGFDGIHITIGKVDESKDSVPEYSCSIVVQGRRAVYTDTSRLINSMSSLSDVPNEWLDAVKEDAPKEACGKDADLEYCQLYDSYWNGELSDADYLSSLDALRRQKGDSKSNNAVIAFGSSLVKEDFSTWKDIDKQLKERENGNDKKSKKDKRNGRMGFLDPRRYSGFGG